MRAKKRTGKGRILLGVIVIIAICLFYLRSAYNSSVYLKEQTITIEKGDTIAKFYKDLRGVKKTMMKLWLKNHSKEIPLLQEGTYPIKEWKYTKQEFLDIIAAGPKKEYLHVTVLEGWSKYDIDAMLVEKGYINPWAFIAKVDNQQYVTSLINVFPFLQMIPQGKSLEGFLYPDTYYLDENMDIMDQLIQAQLKNFDKKVRSQYASSFEVKDVPLTPYQIITLASVIENEEKVLENKPIIAGIFVNRLLKGMRLDADVTLCYGLAITYNKCRDNILANLDDASNLYNTRQNVGLTPTPISSPTLDTITSLLNYRKTNALYYLHDEKWGIHYAETLEQHNVNKEKYL